MTIFLLILLVFIIISIVGILNHWLQLPETIHFQWGHYSGDIDSLTFISLLLIVCVIFYLIFTLFASLFRIRGYIKKRDDRRQLKRSRLNLTQGLLNMIEGQHEQAEVLLLERIEHAEIPTLNYLALANIAQHQNNFSRRDYFLAKAHQLKMVTNNNMDSAIAIAQATMQIQSQQYELARATLSSLLASKPKHQVAHLMLLQTLYYQKDWRALLALLQQTDIENIKNHPLPLEGSIQEMETETLKGILKMTVQHTDEQPAVALRAVWQNVPHDLKKRPVAIIAYAQALDAAKASDTAAQLILKTLSSQWDEDLMEAYSLLNHSSPSQAIIKIQTELKSQKNSPTQLLALARLHKVEEQFDKAINYYQQSINRAPNSDAYWELGQLLDQQKDDLNAKRCYRAGLDYCLHQKGVYLTIEN